MYKNIKGWHGPADVWSPQTLSNAAAGTPLGFDDVGVPLPLNLGSLPAVPDYLGLQFPGFLVEVRRLMQTNREDSW